MKTTNILTTTILAIAGVALTASSAQALTYNNGDIFAGFRATGGTGGTSDYIINLGSISQFQAGGSLADGNLHSLSLTNLGADLTTNFGGWYNRSDFLFSIFGVVKPGGTIGAQSYGNQTMFWSNAETTIGTQSIAQKGFAAASLGTPTNNMVAVGNTYAGSSQLSGETQAGGLLQAIANSNTYGNTTSNFSGAAYPANKYFTLTPFKEPETGFNNTPKVLDLYQINSGNTGNAALVGGFGINSTGNISFSTDLTDFIAPVPEPASAGALFSAFLGLVGLSKRRRAARAVRA